MNAKAGTKGDRGTVSRVLRALSYVAQARSDFGIKDMADALALPQSSVHRLLRLLAVDGFVGRGAGRRYRAGDELLRLARATLDGHDVSGAVLSAMRRVVDGCGETCLLAFYREHNHTMSYVARVESARPLRYRVRLHGEETLAWGASGRAILAFLPPTAVADVVAAAPPSPASRSRPTVTGLRSDLAAVRRAGYAMSQVSGTEGAASIAVPIWSAGERVIGSLGVVIPEVRHRASDERAIAAILLRESGEVSRLFATRSTSKEFL